MTYTEFKEFAEAIQAIILSLGIIIGGIWAIYRFLTLHEIDKARIELAQIQKQLEERGTIKLSAEVKQTTYNDDFAIITVYVTMENTGNRTELLNLSTGDIRISSLDISDENKISLNNSITTRLPSASVQTIFSSIAPNDQKCYPFIFKLKKGNYLFECRLPGSLIETQKHLAGANGVGDVDEVVWSITKFVSVDFA